MTEEQIKTACIEYCRLTGQDPMIEIPNFSFFMFEDIPPKPKKQWELYRGEIIKHYQLTEAIKYAQEGFRNE
jgi:hypothetical protein